MEVTQKPLTPEQKRQRVLTEQKAAELNLIPTPMLLQMAAKQLEDIQPCTTPT
jgi:hypothetical protein